MAQIPRRHHRIYRKPHVPPKPRFTIQLSVYLLIVVGLDLGVARRAAVIAQTVMLVPPARAARAGVVLAKLGHCDFPGVVGAIRDAPD